MSEDLVTARICTKCGATKPLTAFYRLATGKYGRKSQCKACQIAVTTAWIKANREHFNDLNADWQRERYQNDPEYRERKKAAAREYRRKRRAAQSRALVEEGNA